MTGTTITGRIYDDFTDPGLDRWRFLEYPPGPDGSVWRCEEPSARTEVGGGTLRIRVERFEKHLLLSTASIPVPPSGRLSVTADVAATGIGAAPRDYRDGFASLNVLDLASGWVFDVCVTSDAVLAIHERLPVPGVTEPFTHVVEHPLAGVRTGPGRRHRCTVALDADRGTARWWVDDRLVYAVSGAAVPDRVTLGLGLITLHPVDDGHSTSLRGQGLDAEFGPVVLGS